MNWAQLSNWLGPIVAVVVAWLLAQYQQWRSIDNSDGHRLDKLEIEARALRAEIELLRTSDDGLRSSLESLRKDLTQTREALLTAIARIEGKLNA